MCRKITSHWKPFFSKKMAAAASFSYKIGSGGKDFATLLADVLTWSGYWAECNISFQTIIFAVLIVLLGIAQLNNI